MVAALEKTATMASTRVPTNNPLVHRLAFSAGANPVRD